MDIAGTLSSTLKLSYEVIKYLKKVKKGDKERNRVMEALQATNEILSELEAKVQEPGWDRILESLRKADGTLQKLKKLVEDLKSKICVTDDKNWFRRTKTKMLWPFTQADVNQMVAALESIKSALSLALEVRHMYISHSDIVF
jgi:Zn-dependent oligopeptidase